MNGETGENGGGPLEKGLESGVKEGSKDAVNRALNATGDFLKKKFGEASVLLGNGFRRYLENACIRYNKIQTLATGDRPWPIVGPNNIYIQIGVSHAGKEISTSTVEPLLRISNNILILGTGGAGKSMLMKYLFLNTRANGKYIPVFLELRRISGQASGPVSIPELVYAFMKSFDVELPREQFEYSLRLGKYLFLMDGFDEVKESIAVETAEAIQAFSAKYPKNAYIITSRDRPETSVFETFEAVQSMNMNRAQAVELAKKISKTWPYDTEKSVEFCRQLEETLYERHRDFAENPLLLSMMFLTFMRNNSIPDNLARFYQEAYEALYSKHDTRNKGYFQREFRCRNLDEEKFTQLFARFCFQTYLHEKYEFSKTEILSDIDANIWYFGVENVTAKDFLSDLCYIICMILKEGTVYRFSHRSFQAYFAARYTASLPDPRQKKLFEKFVYGGVNYWKNRDYYELVIQLERERFFANALEKGLRILQQEADSSSRPEIVFLRYMCHYPVMHSMDYYVYIQELKQIICFDSVQLFPEYQNIPDIFLANVIFLFYNYYMNTDSNAGKLSLFRSARNAVQFLVETGIRFPVHVWNLNDRSSVIRYLHISELRAAIREYLADLDARRAALESDDFIDEL